MKKFLFLLAIPSIASAQQTNIQRLIASVGRLINQLTILVAGIAVLVFLWGLARFIFKADSKDAQEEGKNLMVWGLVALFVMFSVWGIVYFLQGELGLRRNFPGIDTPSGALDKSA